MKEPTRSEAMSDIWGEIIQTGQGSLHSAYEYAIVLTNRYRRRRGRKRIRNECLALRITM